MEKMTELKEVDLKGIKIQKEDKVRLIPYEEMKTNLEARAQESMIVNTGGEGPYKVLAILRNQDGGILFQIVNGFGEMEEIHVSYFIKDA